MGPPSRPRASGPALLGVPADGESFQIDGGAVRPCEPSPMDDVVKKSKFGICTVRNASELRALARRKRHSAAVARRASPHLSFAADWARMLRYAQELEAEAAELEALADALDLGRPSC